MRSQVSGFTSRFSTSFQVAVPSCKIHHQGPAARFNMQLQVASYESRIKIQFSVSKCSGQVFASYKDLSFKFPDAAPRFKIRVQIQLSASRCSWNLKDSYEERKLDVRVARGICWGGNCTKVETNSFDSHVKERSQATARKYLVRCCLLSAFVCSLSAVFQNPKLLRVSRRGAM